MRRDRCVCNLVALDQGGLPPRCPGSRVLDPMVRLPILIAGIVSADAPPSRLSMCVRGLRCVGCVGLLRRKPANQK